MEEHVAEGILTAKTHWRDYCIQVKDLPPYLAVASNASGSTPKDLFEDVAEELQKQYHEDKTQIKDAMKIGKISLASSWTFEDFKASVAGIDSLKGISEINLKVTSPLLCFYYLIFSEWLVVKDVFCYQQTSYYLLLGHMYFCLAIKMMFLYQKGKETDQLVFDELLERLREKEEKEAKKRQRLADNFSDLLYSIKEITASSKWEECKLLFEDSQEYRSIDDDTFGKEIFEGYVAHLQEKLKEKNKRKKKREREKEKGKDRVRKDETESDNVDLIDGHVSKDRKRDKDKERKHRKRHHSTADDLSSDKDEKEESKKSRRHSGDRKKSRK
ncbi:unnamed protein product, partial [Musa acuminata subsp. burmannicoides]